MTDYACVLRCIKEAISMNDSNVCQPLSQHLSLWLKLV